MIEPNFSGKVIIVSAPSGAGKTTLVKRLLNSNLPIEFSISACNRNPRENETDKKDYYFLSTEEFKSKIKWNKFIEWEEVYPNNFYGTLKEEINRIWNLNKHVIFDVDVVGGISLKKYFSKNALSIFIKPPSLEELSKRLKKRNTESTQSLKTRLEKSNNEMKYLSNYDQIIENDNLDIASQKIREIVKTFLEN
jgi:guanylate kinase